MKILIICESINTLGGSLVSASRFISGLSVNNQIILYTTKLPKDFKLNLKLQNKNVIIREYFSSFGTGGQKFKHILPNFSLKKDFNLDHPDLIYSIHPSLVSKYVLKLAKKNKIPFVSHVHVDKDQLSFQLPDNILSKIILKQLNKLMYFVYNNSSYLIYPSKSAFDRNTSFIQNKNYCIISNGIDLNTFKKDKTNKLTLLRKYNLTNNSKKVLFVGRFNKEKNLDLLLKVTKLYSHKAIEFLIVGEGNLKKKYVEKYAASKNIAFLGFISIEELIKVYSISDIFVLPSIFELEGMVVLEAMACGLPVLISNHKDNASKQFVNDNGFIFKYNSTNDLKEKLDLLLQNDNLRKRMSKQSLKIAKQYSFNNSVKKMELVFKKLVNKNRIN